MRVLIRTTAAIVAVLSLCVILPFTGQTAATAMAAGTPMTLPPVDQGAPYVTYASLPAGVAISGSVTGPFLIAMQTNFAYGSIDGIQFGTTASTDGKCNEDGDYGCDSYLLIEQLPSAPVGLGYGTVTLSNGTSFEVVSNVRPAGVIVSPSHALELETEAGNSGDPLRFSLTNATPTALSIGKPSFIDESNSGQASAFTFSDGCGNSLAAGATCFIGVTYPPSTNQYVAGFVQVPTGAGAIEAPYSFESQYYPNLLQIDPMFLDFDVGSDGRSAVRTITITNLASQSESIGLSASGSGCEAIFGEHCLNIVSNNCGMLPSQGTCEAKVQFVIDTTQAFGAPVHDYFYVSVSPYTGPGSGKYLLAYDAYPSPGPPNPAVILASPSTLQFPATPFGQVSDPQTVTVTNVSARTLTIAAPSVTDFVVESSCIQLAPGQSCELLVHFVPISGDPETTDSLIVTATDVADPTGLTTNQSQQTVTVIRSTIPQASLASPSFVDLIPSINFDSSVSLMVTNTSPVPLVFGSISGNRDYFAGQAVIVDTTGCGASLAPGKSCTLVVNAHKCEDEEGECWVTLQSNALSSPDYYTFDGDELADTHSKLTVDAGPVVFPQTPTGALSASQVVHVTLTNAVSAVNEAFDVLPAADPDFKVDNQCPKVLVPLAASTGFATACQMVVTFAPQAPGFHAGVLAYRSSLQGDSVLLAGTGTVPALSLQPTSLQFPSTAAGLTATAQVVTVQNPGGSAVSISSIRLIGAQADDFAIAKTCGSSLAAGASCTLSVTFKPVSAGTKRAGISITDSVDGAPLSIALSGTGTAGNSTPSLRLSASALTFASQVAGTSSAAQTVTLTNSGTASLTLTSISLTGGQADDYVLATTCGASLAPTASCTLSVTFNPVSAGTKLASVTLVDNAGDSPQLIALTGKGTAASTAPGG